MSSSRTRSRRYDLKETPDVGKASLFWMLWVLIFIGTLIPAAPWSLQHGILFAGFALLMLIFRPKVALPKLWLGLAAAFLLLGLAAFLPSSWFALPDWKSNLQRLGVDMGPVVAVQWRQATEQYIAFAVLTIVGAWICSQRAALAELKNIALAFVVGVAIYAMASEWLKDILPVVTYDGHFGFFPNRNHSGTYLAMGTVCGFGVILHSIRNKDFARMAAALAATGISIWAAFGWSISRAGILLCAIGLLLWAILLGRKYWGRQELRAIGLLGLLVIGCYFLAETRVKDRINKTADKISEVASQADESEKYSGDGSELNSQNINEIDGRIPIGIDAIHMIGAAPLTGVGAGQFRYVFPQFRNLSSVVNDAECLHPENDWLWMAAELGIPATLALATLVLAAYVYGIKNIRSGKDRAIRMGCLIASAIVPIHGCFDVPGHRVALAGASLLLYAISLNRNSLPVASGRSYKCFGAIAIVIAVLAIRLLGVSWFGFSEPYLTRGRQDLNRGSRIYRDIIDAKSKASALMILNQREDLYHFAKNAAITSPLERQLYLLQGLALVSIKDQWTEADRVLAVDRLLAPHWVRIPLIHSAAWFSYDPERAQSLWLEAISRGRKIDQVAPGSNYSEKRTIAAIRSLVHGQPLMRKAAEKMIEENQHAF